MKYLIAKQIYEYNKEYDYYSRTEYGVQLADTICEYLLEQIKDLDLQYTSNEFENIQLIINTLNEQKNIGQLHSLNSKFNLNLDDDLLDEYLTDIIETDLPTNLKFKDFICEQSEDKFKKLFNMSREQLYRKITTIVVGEILANLVTYLSKLAISDYDINDSQADNIIHDIFYKIGKDETFGNMILQQHFSLSPEKAYRLIGEDWDTIIYDGKYLSEVDRKELIDHIKKTVLNLNPRIRGNKSEYLLNLDNDDKIGQYYGSINYDPHDLSERDAPIIVCREFINNGYKDHVLFGIFGQHHYHVQDKYSSLMQRCMKDNVFYCSECYLYGKVAFVEKHSFSGFSSIEEVAKILRNDPRIMKVYLSPGRRGGFLKRLAKKF